MTLIVSGQKLDYLEPCGCAEGQLGGFPRRDSILLQLASDGKNLLPVANGNLISDAGRQSELKAEIAFTALKEMGYVAFNVGSRDLLLGVEQLKYFSNTSGIPFLSTNLFQGDEHVFQPFVFQSVKHRDRHVRVAIVGIISQQFGIYAESASVDLKLKTPEVVLKKVIPQLSNESEFIVLLAHADIAEAKALAKTFPQIDVVVTGREQDEELKQPIFVRSTVLLNPGKKGKFLGSLDIRWNNNEKRAKSHFELLTLSERIPDSPRMVDLLALYQQMLASESLAEDVEQVVSTGGMYVGNASCKGCHAAEYTSWNKTKHAHAYHTLVEKGHAADLTCLTCHTDEKFSILRVETTSPFLTSEVLPLNSDRFITYEVKVLLHSGAPVGQFKETLVIHSNGAHRPRLDVPIEGNVLGPITVSPEHLFFGFVSPGEGAHREILLTKAGEATLQVLEVGHQSQFVSVKIAPIDIGRKVHVHVQLSPNVSSGPFRDVLEIYTNNATQPVIQVPLHALVRK